MGYGNYSHAAHTALIAGPRRQARRRGLHAAFHACADDPHGLKVRESRDNADHPNSLGIVFALDVTGSMGDIPQTLARRELPNFMKLLTDCGVPDPQLMFMAIGDATSDGAPLQVGQFESTANLMDQWLTWSYLEGGGGGSGEESYELAFLRHGAAHRHGLLGQAQEAWLTCSSRATSCRTRPWRATRSKASSARSSTRTFPSRK
jgi:hypothetical protein